MKPITSTTPRAIFLTGPSEGVPGYRNLSLETAEDKAKAAGFTTRVIRNGETVNGEVQFTDLETADRRYDAKRLNFVVIDDKIAEDPRVF